MAMSVSRGKSKWQCLCGKIKCKSLHQVQFSGVFKSVICSVNGSVLCSSVCHSKGSTGVGTIGQRGSLTLYNSVLKHHFLCGQQQQIDAIRASVFNAAIALSISSIAAIQSVNHNLLQARAIMLSQSLSMIISHSLVVDSAP